MILMESLPRASPFAWADDDEQSSRILIKKRKGSGLSFLQNKNIQGEAKRIMLNLLEADPETQDTSHLATSLFYANGGLPASVADEKTEESDIIRLAQEGNLSLFLSILRHFDQQTTSLGSSVPTKTILRSCVLAVNPSCTPGNLDAKDMVLTALQFLSCSASLDGRIKLPLIEATDQNLDLEKRIYNKVGQWKWADFENNTALSELEMLFNLSPIGREKFVPRFLSDEDEQPLLQKGVIPPSAAPKRKGPAPGFRRKPTASPSAAIS
mmetsp:Transcript_30743/g.35053  ORF Transcript_30743/g.35053 Transcript_30743/m.35053 type:complete len:268 (-) Transcript_30743:100-903(-)|eukprot:CAMPEP_0194132916 /NCGR_PEP_ID=MMETSP0152-20130528/3262_1 /TAXON_ID=1049557 /ORGANISM="Thalassiothrix antarctica, Strain L6-D1" /LENGTH=267 /DNA_ID=CAMNT_0038828109 /DNA_START=54 /DNA_END=857 /DNA_ORIENTATION=+